MVGLAAIGTIVVGLTGCAESGSSTHAAGATRTVDAARVGYYGYGTPASAATIAGWDIDIRPDGVGLPPGSGSVADGETLYEAQCAECHGSFGEGVGRFPVLAGGQGSLSDDRPTKTVGSYWPYASTLFDYIRRTMPFPRPESLSAEETYAVTAYVLYLNDLVADDFVLSDANLPTIRMPNESNFVPDPRPDVANVRCMDACRDPAGIRILSEVAHTPREPETVAAAAASTAPGQPTYEQFCSICHAAGVGGAPQPGDPGQWATRIAQGIPTLVAHAIEGTSSASGVMPPKGGFNQLSDEEIDAAVRYMVEASR